MPLLYWAFLGLAFLLGWYSHSFLVKIFVRVLTKEEQTLSRKIKAK